MTTISAPILKTSPWNTPLTPYERFKRNPALFLAQHLYSYRPPLIPHPIPKTRPSINIVCISDTHNTQLRVPSGDILLHAGDLSVHGTFAELQSQLHWLNTLPHTYKLVIAGNHDILLDPSFFEQFPHRISNEPGATAADLQWGDIIYLNDSSTTVTVHGRVVKIFGSPLTPQFGTFAFQYPPIRDVWKGRIPDGTDILLTHGPPRSHLDEGGKGCEWLLRELWRSRARPRVVVCGHIHEGRGLEELSWDETQRVYDGVGVGDKGLVSVLWMAVLLVFVKILSLSLLVVGTKRRTVATTTLVNAAVVAGNKHAENRPAMVVEI